MADLTDRLNALYQRLKTGSFNTTINNSELANTSGNIDNYGDLRFPSDIDVIDHWVTFTIFEYSRENRSAQPKQKAIKGHITLPIPANLQTGFNALYTNEAMGIMGHAGMGAASLVKQLRSEPDNQSLAESINSQIAEATKTATGLMAGFALDKFPSQEFAAGAQAALGLARNPHLAVIYQGPDFRSHNFQYRFSPRNEEESNTLRRIISTIKYAMAPDITESFSNHLFKYPDEVIFEFHHKDYLFAGAPSVFKNITIDYHSSGTPAYFKDTNAPVDITINFQLQETTILTKPDMLNFGF